MKAKKRLAAKPGARPGAFRPDNIENYEVASDDTLLAFLIKSMPQRTRTTVKDYLEHRQVMVGGAVTSRYDFPLKSGDTVKVNTTREFQVFTHPRLRIVHEDDDIIVIDKGYGLLSMGTDRIKDGTAYSILREYLKRKLFIVHRLDRDTTGLMMFAKNEKAKETMQHNWNNMVLERKYVAVVEGTIEPREGQIRSYLAENSAHEVYSVKDSAMGQLAVTNYVTIAARGPYSMVELSLATGRKNQIRVHMKDAGHPISGDRRYGASPSPAHRLCLHAATLRFVHPVTRRDMNFSSPVPASFRRLVR